MKLIKFFTKNCAMCKQQEAEFKNRNFTDVEIVNVDLDEAEKEYADIFDFCRLPTMVLMRNFDTTMEKDELLDNRLFVWQGFTPVPVIKPAIERFICD